MRAGFILEHHNATRRRPASRVSKPQRDNAHEDDRRGGGALRLERLTEQLTPITANTTEVSRELATAAIGAWVIAQITTA